jgi:hypothetical protein
MLVVFSNKAERLAIPSRTVVSLYMSSVKSGKINARLKCLFELVSVYSSCDVHQFHTLQMLLSISKKNWILSWSSRAS